MKEKNEYIIPDYIKRIIIPKFKLKNIFKEINRNKIDISIFQVPFEKDLYLLNKLKNSKIIFFNHYSLFYWINKDYSLFKCQYKSYKLSKYVISLIPLENDYNI